MARDPDRGREGKAPTVTNSFMGGNERKVALLYDRFTTAFFSSTSQLLIPA
jgi:hypothetical protein